MLEAPLLWGFNFFRKSLNFEVVFYDLIGIRSINGLFLRSLWFRRQFNKFQIH